MGQTERGILTSKNILFQVRVRGFDLFGRVELLLTTGT